MLIGFRFTGSDQNAEVTEIGKLLWGHISTLGTMSNKIASKQLLRRASQCLDIPREMLFLENVFALLSANAECRNTWNFILKEP